ncbi:MAG: acetylglutamate kinase [Myxococcota bacterium]
MDRVISLLDAIPYVRAYAGQTFVVKAGGEIVGEPRWRAAIARDLAVLHRLGIGVVLVHGGGPQLDAAAARAGVKSETVAGRRITSPELMRLAVIEWRGVLSTALVGALRAAGERAVGLGGGDGDVVTAKRRPPALVTTDEGERRAVDYGLVGDVTGVNVSALRAVLGMPAIPVITPLAAGDGEELLNVNADTVAAEVAVALGAAKLVVLTRSPGILTDPGDPSSVLHWTDLVELGELEQRGAIRGGMRPKLAAIRKALAGGVPRVHVVDGRRQGALLEEVFTTEGAGTLVVTEADDTPAEPMGVP